MKKTLLLFLFLTSTFLFSQEVQEKYQRAKINYNSTDDLSRLESLGVPVEHGTHKRGHFVISDFSVSEIETARNAGFKVDVLIEDSKQYFLQRNQQQPPLINNPSCDGASENYETPANFNLGSMGGYLTYQELLDELDAMRAQYTDLITEKEDISSFLTEGTPDNSTTPSIGGNGIKWVKISDNPENTSEGEPQILYTSLHHAREPLSLSQLVFYMWYLLENYDSNPEVQSIVNNTELYFIPVVNPDGYLYNEKTDPNGGGFWRKNRKNSYGTDLNRNYDYYINGDPNDGVWGGEGASSNTSSETYHGPAPFSEVETQAVKWFVENHDFVMAFNNHTSGDLLLYPYGYTDDAPTAENDLFVGISEELVSRNGFSNILSSELYPAAGDSDDFMYGTVGTHDKIYAMTPEIGPEFWPPSNQIEPLVKTMMYLNLTSAKMVNNFAEITDTAPTFTGSTTSSNATFNIKRLGINGDGNFTVSLNPVSANITSAGNPVTFNSLELLEEDTGSIEFSISTDIEAGDDIAYELVVNNGSYDTATLINKKFGELEAVFEDPGESVTDNFNNNGWGISTTTFVSAPSSITDSPSGNYQDNANKTITLKNAIDLTNAIGANVTFNAKWEIENNWDYTQFEVSTDNGTSWTPQCGKFTNPGSTNSGQPTGQPLYDGEQNDWVLEEIDLSDYLGESILVRFEFESDGGVTGDGFYFDDLTINIVNDSGLSVSDVSENLFSIYPNPVDDLLNINTLLDNYSAELFTIQGQRVFVSENNTGSQTLDYSSYGSGIYFLKLTSTEVSQTFKIVKQ
tara:strand:+ start:21476 stop:23872 length:2397 start_codon:yes stop_codon:yes gene_type:complete